MPVEYHPPARDFGSLDKWTPAEPDHKRRGRILLTEEKPLKQLTILLIDDLDMIVEVLGAALSEAGYKVIGALSGKDALSLFRNNHVDIILTDLCMPDMNGLDVARSIRHLCATRGLKKPLVILVTGCAGQISSDRRIAQSGVDAVVGKPFGFEKLVEAIDRALRGSCE